MIELAEQYIKDVSTGKIVTGNYVKLAIKRHLLDLKNAKKKGLYFDKDAAYKVLCFVSMCRHTKGRHKGELFRLQPFQAFIIYCLYGWRRTKDGTRRFTRMYLEIARKNGKSELLAALSLYHLLADSEPGAECYTAATKYDQAKIVFNQASIMLKSLRKDSDTVRKLTHVLKDNIHVSSTDSKLEPLTSDHNKQDGFNPSFASIDEYQAHRSAKLLDVISTGSGARESSMICIITTAGYLKTSPCARLRKVCTDILSGQKEDDTTFTIVYTIDKGDSWQDPEVWVKSNPALGAIIREDWLKDQCKKAVNEGAEKEIEFKTKNLNIWTNTHTTWISYEKWQSSGTQWGLETLKGRPCYGGLDLSTIHDLTALALYFPALPGSDEIAKCLVFTWCPEETIRDRTEQEGVPYLDWQRAGYLESTPGQVVNYNFIEKRVLEIAEKYDVRCINYDRWNSSQLVTNLENEGLEMVPFGQGYRSLSTPTKEIHKLIISKKLDHRRNELLAWAAGNVSLMIDPAENVKPDKKNSTERIDPVLALVMAVGAHLQNGDEGRESIYNSKEVIVI